MKATLSVPEGVISDFRATLRQVADVLVEFGQEGEGQGASRLPSSQSGGAGQGSAEALGRALVDLAEMRVRLRKGRALLLIEAGTQGSRGSLPARGGALSQAAAVLLDVEATITRIGEIAEAWVHELSESSEAALDAVPSQGV